ncbi:MAG: TetR-like C-terminal domain-containing protein [Clostridiaceae bacterium]|nr:TetR-like C-terminal domain-containing protein [Clostridiaceae bacterium]
MKTEKIDRRVKYTKSLLKDSLIKLMQTNPISKISVKMLCEDADINRSTFYSHFDDQYDLLRWIEHGVIADFNAYINEHMLRRETKTTILILKQLLDYAAEDIDLFKVLLSNNGDTEFHEDLMSLVQGKLISDLRAEKNLSERSAEYLKIFVLATALQIVQKWLQDGMIESNQEIAELISNLLFSGMSYYF